MKKFLSVLLISAVFLSGSAFAGIGAVPESPQRLTGALKYWFTYDLQAGDEIKDVLKVVNTSRSSSVDVRVYGADYTPSSTGSFSLKGYYTGTNPRYQHTMMGTWITFDTGAVKKLRLAPGETVLVPFKLRIPKGVAPEDMKGGLAAEQIKTSYSRRGRGISVVTRAAVQVYANPAALPEKYQ